MRTLNINIVTYVPKGWNRTMLEGKNKLIPSLRINRIKGFKVKLNILINNSNDSAVVKQLMEYLGNIPHQIISTTENNLMKARNTLLEKSFKDPEDFVMQLDDDDRMMDNWVDSIEAIMKSDVILEDKLNFYMFKWERDDGDFLMPKDIKSKPIEELGRSTFTFSNWGWIAKASYLMKMGLRYPNFIESPKLDDNYFHIRSIIMNPEANFILTPLYIWNNKDNKSSVSNRSREFVDNLMEYFKFGGPGYKMTPYVIRENKLVKLKDLSSFSYPQENLVDVLIKGRRYSVTAEFSFKDMCYYYGNTPIKNLMSLRDFYKNYSTFQMRLMAQQFGAEWLEAWKRSTEEHPRTENRMVVENPLLDQVYIGEL